MADTRRSIALFAVTAVISAVAGAQTGHPAKGSWLGYWGPNDAEQRRIRLLLDWKNRAVVGTINPGRNGVEIDATQLDYDTWTLTIEADMPAEDGDVSRFVATGKLENLGSWTNRRYAGTYTFGDESGEFTMLIN